MSHPSHKQECPSRNQGEYKWLNATGLLAMKSRREFFDSVGCLCSVVGLHLKEAAPGLVPGAQFYFIFLVIWKCWQRRARPFESLKLWQDATNATLGQKDKGKSKGNRKAGKKATTLYLQVNNFLSIFTFEFQNNVVLTSFNRRWMGAIIFFVRSSLHS